jgi:uncharacterized protein
MKFVITFVCAMCCSSISFAALPSTASVEHLLALTGSQKMLDGVYQQMDGFMRSTMNQELAKNPKLTSADREKIQKNTDAFAKKLTDIYREELSWAKLEKMYVQIYSETFSQEEVDALIAFYESPAGKTYVEKMPLVLQKAMGEMQQLIGPIMEKVRASTQEFAKSAAQQSSAQSSAP